MFLEATLARNRPLVDFALDAVVHGELAPASYVIDLDSVARNAELLRDAAAASGLRLHFMAKQVGRQPDVIRVVGSIIPSAVAVNIDDARAIVATGVPLGHAGHLVQPGLRQIRELLAFRPAMVTVYSVEMAAAIGAIARSSGRRQELLARVVADGDRFHPGQEGGIRLEDFGRFREALASIDAVHLAGVTTYPSLEVGDDRVEPSPNLGTILRAASSQPPLEIVNAPGHTAVSTIPLLAGLGATEGEPGHALTGTTPLHANGREPETPAAVFVTEVSHRIAPDRVAVLGGGFYARGRASSGLLRAGGSEFHAQLIPPPPDAIDYYATLLDEGRSRPGDVVVFAFRFQAFATRAPVAAVTGIGTRPRVMSVADPFGHRLG